MGLRDGRVETFHSTNCSEYALRQFSEWLEPRQPGVFVSDNPESEGKRFRVSVEMAVKSERFDVGA